jgi:hypothetical protein
VCVTCPKLIDINQLISTGSAEQSLGPPRPRAIIALELESLLQYTRERAGTNVQQISVPNRDPAEVVGSLKCGLFPEI